MSAEYMGAVWKLDLPHNEALVLLAMADHADHDGRNIFPSVALIAWKTGYDERQVSRVMKVLRDKGILECESIGPSGTKIYRINLERAALKAPYVRRASGRPSNYERGL